MALVRYISRVFYRVVVELERPLDDLRVGADPAGARSPGKGNEPEEQTEQLHFILFLFFLLQIFFFSRRSRVRETTRPLDDEPDKLCHFKNVQTKDSSV